MSVKASTWAWEQIEAGRIDSPSHRLVLVALADRANDDGVAWPGHGSLARKTGLDRKTVGRAIAALADPAQPGGPLLTYEHRYTQHGDPDTNIYTLAVYGHGGGGVSMSLPLPPVDYPVDKGVDKPLIKPRGVGATCPEG